MQSMTKNFVACRLVIDYSLIIGNNQWLINWLPIDYLLITHLFHWCHWCHRLVMTRSTKQEQPGRNKHSILLPAVINTSHLVTTASNWLELRELQSHVTYPLVKDGCTHLRYKLHRCWHFSAFFSHNIKLRGLQQFVTQLSPMLIHHNYNY